MFFFRDKMKVLSRLCLFFLFFLVQNPAKASAGEPDLLGRRFLFTREGSPPFSFVFFSISLSLANNCFTISQYNRFNGSYLTPSDKEAILRAVDRDFYLTGKGEVGLFNLRLFSSYLASSLIGLAEGEIDRDFFQILLKGNEMNRSYEIEKIKGKAILYSEVKFGTGFRLIKKDAYQLSISTGIKYLRGIYLFQSLQGRGYLITTPEYLNSRFEIEAKESRGGAGFGLDWILAFNKGKFTFELFMDNINSGILWQKQSFRIWGVFGFESLNYDKIKAGNYYIKEVEKTPIPPFRYYLPITSGLMVNYSLRPRTQIIIQTTIEDLFRFPSLSFYLSDWLGRFPIGAGFKIGGREVSVIKFDLSLIWKSFSLTFTSKWTRGLFLQAKGQEIGIAGGFNLYPRPERENRRFLHL